MIAGSGLSTLKAPVRAGIEATRAAIERLPEEEPFESCGRSGVWSRLSPSVCCCEASGRGLTFSRPAAPRTWGKAPDITMHASMMR